MIAVLHVPDCPHLDAFVSRLRSVTSSPIAVQVVTTEAEAVDLGMAGSPTLLVDGQDPFRTSQAPEYGLSCRLYRDEHNHPVAVPSLEQFQVALGNDHAEVLSAWRRRAIPLEPALRSLHQTVLKAFATGSSMPQDAHGLRELHSLDALRLGSDGQIAVAYPFSATPTRHRVRIGAAEVYAMCAIDALGIGPMLGTETVISSVDVTTGRPITVSGPDWSPADAVVFVGATGSGPSADCCCDFLNFFESHDSATAWMTAHPDVPGQILDQSAAQALATRLFGHLLAS